MPTEKELIPPLVDILLERGHTNFSLPFLLRYVIHNGWNTVMIDFARHKRFKGKWAQETLRFLRFHGQRPIVFRQFVFYRYLERTLFLAVSMIFLLLAGFIFFLFGIRKLFLTVTVFGAVTAIYFLIRYIVMKKMVLMIPSSNR